MNEIKNSGIAKEGGINKESEQIQLSLGYEMTKIAGCKGRGLCQIVTRLRV
jgi:hypothetical protein